MTLANFVEYAKAKHEVFSVDDGEKRIEIHVAFCDGRSGTGFVLPHIWNFYSCISNMSFSEKQTKIDLFGLTLGGNAKARWLSELEKAKMALLEANDPEGLIQLDDVINAFIALYCDEEARDAQLAYVRNVHKPYDSMNVRDFQMNLENCNSTVLQVGCQVQLLSSLRRS